MDAALADLGLAMSRCPSLDAFPCAFPDNIIDLPLDFREQRRTRTEFFGTRSKQLMQRNVPWKGVVRAVRSEVPLFFVPSEMRPRVRDPTGVRSEPETARPETQQPTANRDVLFTVVDGVDTVDRIQKSFTASLFATRVLQCRRHH